MELLKSGNIFFWTQKYNLKALNDHYKAIKDVVVLTSLADVSGWWRQQCSEGSDCGISILPAFCNSSLMRPVVGADVKQMSGNNGVQSKHNNVTRCHKLSSSQSPCQHDEKNTI